MDHEYKHFFSTNNDLSLGSNNRPAVSTAIGEMLQANHLSSNNPFNSVTSMPIRDVTAVPQIPRNPNELYLPQGYGNMPTAEVASNGAFHNQPPTQPQKFVFLTYESANQHYYDCKTAMKINIPGGDNGLYKATVNEILFRNDAPIIAAEDTLSITDVHVNAVDLFLFNDKTFLCKTDDAARRPRMTANIAADNLADQIKISFDRLRDSYDLSYITTAGFVKLLKTFKQYLTDTNHTLTFNLEGPFMKITRRDGDTTNYRGNIQVEVDLANLLTFQVDPQSGVGIQIHLGILIPETVELAVYHGDVDQTQTEKFNFIYLCDCTFNLTGTGNIRNILPQLTSTMSLSSKNMIVQGPRGMFGVLTTGVAIPYCNFAGPTVFLFNTSAKSLCPISNDSGAQYNANALSYNTSLECLQLVQMQSNIPIIIRNGMDFRVWLTDTNGNYVKIKSPMYVQITVEPFINAEFYST